VGADFEQTGARLFPAALQPGQLSAIAALFGDGGSPGRRLSPSDLKPIIHLLGSDGPVGRIAAELLGPAARPVRAVLLDKSATANWRLGWHQDRTIAVRERVDVAGFSAWSVKAGQQHVQPPHEITARMVTLRVHVDAVDQANAPLEVLPGSHSLGRLPEAEISRLVQRLRPLVCVAGLGNVWAYRTGIVHASAEQHRPGRRRVLQIDYSADELPGGLEWALLITAQNPPRNAETLAPSASTA
jgi:hypothetical protein